MKGNGCFANFEKEIIGFGLYIIVEDNGDGRGELEKFWFAVCLIFYDFFGIVAAEVYGEGGGLAFGELGDGGDEFTDVVLGDVVGVRAGDDDVDDAVGSFVVFSGWEMDHVCGLRPKFGVLTASKHPCGR